jgi:hypothetical protein
MNCDAPTDPPPPLMFSTVMDWPSFASSSGASLRALVSAPPPAPAGMVISIARSGYSASAGAASVASAAAPSGVA